MEFQPVPVPGNPSGVYFGVSRVCCDISTLVTHGTHLACFRPVVPFASIIPTCKFPLFKPELSHIHSGIRHTVMMQSRVVEICAHGHDRAIARAVFIAPETVQRLPACPPGALRMRVLTSPLLLPKYFQQLNIFNASVFEVFKTRSKVFQLYIV